MKKFIVSIIFVLVFFTSVFAQKYRKPSSDEVVLVFSVSMRPSINRAFFEQYLKVNQLMFSSVKITSKGSMVREAPSDTISLYSDVRSEYPIATANVDDTGLISVNVKFVKDVDMLSLEYLMYNIFGGNAFVYNLPLSLGITVPKDSKYLYLGHFEFRTKNGVEGELAYPKHSDKIEQAKAIIKERYGNDAQLIRASITTGK